MCSGPNCGSEECVGPQIICQLCVEKLPKGLEQQESSSVIASVQVPALPWDPKAEPVAHFVAVA